MNFIPGDLWRIWTNDIPIKHHDIDDLGSVYLTKPTNTSASISSIVNVPANTCMYLKIQDLSV